MSIMRWWWATTVLVLLLLSIAFLHKTGEEGIVIRVVDGDTLLVLINHEERLVRLFGIDAPSLSTLDGRRARDVLLSLCPVGSKVKLLVHGKDVYGRLLATVYNAKGVNVNLTLVKENLATPLFSEGLKLSC